MRKQRIQTKQDLARLQGWMTRAITTPFGKQTSRLAQEADRYLTPSTNLSAKERLDIYVSDYWPRCLGSLAEDFPGVRKILGGEPFDQWMEKYLSTTPSTSYTLLDLGKNLLAFMQRYYKGPHKGPLFEMIRYEWSQIASFNASTQKPFDPRELGDFQRAELHQIILMLQPHVQLLQLNYDILRWLGQSKTRNHTFLKRKNYVITYQQEGDVESDRLEAPFHILLKAFQNGYSLERAINHLWRRIDRTEKAFVQNKLQEWIQICIRKGWLYEYRKN